MSEPVRKPIFVSRIRRAREEWESLMIQVPLEEMLVPGFCDDWSLKDVIAHITWYDREMANMLQAHSFVGSSLWQLPADDRNAAIAEQNKDRNLDEIIEEAGQVFGLLMTLAESLTDEDLNDPARFPGMPLEWQPWQVIASNTYEHYEDHLQQVMSWLSR